MSGASGWNLWVWLECISVVSGWWCKKVYRFPHITYPYSTCISSFLQQHPYFLVKFFNAFSFVIFGRNIANVAQRTVEIIQKSRSRRHGDVIISTITSTTSLETSTYEVRSDVLR